MPNSYTYYQINNIYQDVFKQNGLGLGRTYLKLLPTLRLDYIFINSFIQAKQTIIPKEVISDHKPVITDIYIP